MQNQYELLKRIEELEQFPYIVAHDLQAPLRHISTYIEILTEELGAHDNAEVNFALKTISRSSARMDAMISNLLTLAQANGVKLNLEKVNLTLVLKEILCTLDRQIRTANAEITLQKMPNEIICDTSCISQLLQNLIENALKYRPQGSKSIIEIGCSEKEDCWLFTVKDNGIGIEQKYFTTIFEIFHRLHSQTAFPGTGIGLAICQKVVKLHGGKIWVESVPKEGSVFSFEISKSLKVTE